MILEEEEEEEDAELPETPHELAGASLPLALPPPPAAYVYAYARQSKSWHFVAVPGVSCERNLLPLEAWGRGDDQYLAARVLYSAEEAASLALRCERARSDPETRLNEGPDLYAVVSAREAHAALDAGRQTCKAAVVLWKAPAVRRLVELSFRSAATPRLTLSFEEKRLTFDTVRDQVTKRLAIDPHVRPLGRLAREFVLEDAIK